MIMFLLSVVLAIFIDGRILIVITNDMAFKLISLILAGNACVMF